MSYPGVIDPGFNTREPEELLEHVEVDDLVGIAHGLLDPHAHTLILGHWAREWIHQYLEGMVWEGITSREEPNTGHLFDRLCPAHLEPDALAELGCEARRRGEEIARED